MGSAVMAPICWTKGHVWRKSFRTALTVEHECRRCGKWKVKNDTGWLWETLADHDPQEEADDGDE